MNERVLILRESIVKVTQILAGESIKVTQRGMSAYVKVDATGKPCLVNLPYLPDNASDELCNAIQGFLDHEVAHILFTDFDAVPVSADKRVQRMTNMLEDSRVERKMSERFSGSKYNLSVTGEFFIKHCVEPEYQKAMMERDVNAALASLMVPLLRSMAGQRVFEEYLKDKMKLLAPIHDKIGDLAKDIASLSSTADSYRLATEIQRRLESDGDGDGKDSSDEKDEEGKIGGSTKSKGKKGGKSKPKDEEEKKEDSKPESDEGGAEESEAESSDDFSGLEEVAKAKAVWEELDREGANDYDGAMSHAISSFAKEAADEAEYLIYSNDFDEISPLKVGSGFNPKMLKEMVDSVEHMIGPIQKDLERAISARSMATWEAGRRSGRLHTAGLAKLTLGDDRVFRRRHEGISKDVAVELVVDASGSMAGQKIHIAAQAAYALASVLERIRIPCEVVCFTTKEMEAGEEEKLLREQAKLVGRSRYSRIEPLYMPLLKTFNERMTTDVKNRFGWLPKCRLLVNNVDGESVEVAARRLISRREKGKIMIVLSDGAPACYGGYGIEKHLKDTVKKIEKAGVKVIGIGVQDDAVRKFYSKNIVIRDVKELPDRVVRELRAMLMA